MSKTAEFYCSIAEQAGLDPTEEGTLEKVAAALEAAEGPLLVDYFDQAVDSLIFGHGALDSE